MKKPLYNPFLPLDTYIADGEPHVFGDRVYLFGSHDQENGHTYCMLDYVFWSAPVSDLSDWSNRGVSYSVTQDPLHSEKLKYMYAPDVVQGNNGRFYLYYCLAGEKGAGGYGQPISVAVCDTPDGAYEYLGFVRNRDGSPMQKYVTFDPAVINDQGVIRLYYGTWYPFHEYGILPNGVSYRVESRIFGLPASDIAAYDDGIMGANHVVLEDDMLTVKSEPCHITPYHVKGTSFAEHPFFEASSIRKINGTYYFIYSSSHGHELCYATSPYPDKGFTYGGVIISNGDIGYQGRTPKDRLNTTGTNHGSIENIQGEWYVFYHRNTNKTAYSRQACAERITLLPDGSIPQVEMTSQGLNPEPLQMGVICPAAICCNLTNGKMPHQGNGVIKKHIPYITNRDQERFILVTDKAIAAYKYFHFTQREATLRLKYRAKGENTVSVCVDDASKVIGEKTIPPAAEWSDAMIKCAFPAGRHALLLAFRGKKDMEILELEIQRK